MPESPSPDEPDATPTRDMARALTEIRREGWKVALIYAVADATLAVLVVNLLTTLLGVPGLPARLSLPGFVLDVLRGAGVTVAEPTVAVGVVLGVAAGLVVLVAEVTWRVRRPLVEQFEAANPALRESLRTARDAIDAGRRSTIALRLYEDVLDDLRAASSVGLLDLRRIAVTVVLVSLVSVATIQVAVVDISIGGTAEPTDTAPGGGTTSEYTGLRNGSSILGDPGDATAGEDDLDTTIDTSGAGSGDGADAGSAAAYDNSGFDDAATVESQRAGFTDPEQLEDAELIREYNLRIREDSENE
ncbi:DUF7502 family protein [Haloplanus halobius]|uniref:DUF7502 family protein n=1 Tax=Haloplanus halobius TaxID=2934938 RepID=UPI00200D1238|nr:hypothetical protein [Haloplanus sp. XH21]